jgi:zinc protease
VLPGGCHLAKGPARVGDPGGDGLSAGPGAGDRRVELTLDNGLRVILQENHAAPVVAMQAWVAVGSADEPPPLAGVAHVFEHMLFKGTKRRGVGQIAREVEAAGGDINAWTSFDETVYHLVLASRFFDTGLDILADALVNPTFDPAELERERKVVLEEIRQGRDNPERVLSQMLFSAAYKTHAYGRPTIGSEATVAALTRDQVVAFFQRHYVGRNVTLVVAGDFDAAAAERKVAAAFAPMRRGEASPARPAEPAQTAPRTVVAAARDVREARLLMSFHTPPIEHQDVAALDLLAVILGQGDSSRLHLELSRNRQLVTGARAFMFTSRDGGMLVAGASMPPGRVEEAARVLLDEALRLGRQEVSPDELAKARAILESAIVYDKETVQGYARKVGFFASVAGDASREERYFDQVRRVTPADVKEAAARYLRAANLTTAVLIPDGGVAAAAKGGVPGDLASRLTRALDAVAAGAEARADRRAALAAASAGPAGGVARVVLPSGVRVLVLRDPSVPVVSVEAVWPGGLRNEDARTNGVSSLLAAVLPRGTRGRSAEQIETEVEGMAGQLSGFAGRNALGLRAEVLAAHWERGLELLVDCIRNPRIAEDEVERERRVILQDIRAQQDNLGQVALHLFQTTLWQRHPYRLDVVGSVDAVSSLTRRKLVEHYRRYYPTSALTIAVVGDVDAERVLAKVQSLFADAPAVPPAPPAGSPGPAPTPAAEPPRDAPAEVFQLMPREQAHVVIGYPGATVKDADRFALEILSQILSGQGGRLFIELREKQSLAYQVSATSVEGIDPGYFAVYLACSPANLDQGVRGIRAELGRVAADGVTREEVERARKHLIGAQAIGLQRRSALADAIALGEAYGRGWRDYRRYGEEIDKVTPDDVRRVARKYLDTRREVVAVVKPDEPAWAVGKADARSAKPGATGAPGAKTAVGVGRAAP